MTNMDNQTNKKSGDEKIVVVENRQPNRELATIDLNGLKVKRGGNIIIGTLNVIVRPAKKRWRKHYQPKKNIHWYWHLTIDALLVLIIFGLIALNAQFYFQNKNLAGYWPNQKPTIDYPGVVNAKLILNLTSTAITIDPGQAVFYALKYENDNDYVLENVEVTVDIDNLLAQEKSLSWNQDNLPALKSIQPHSTGLISFSINTKLLEIQTAAGQGHLISKVQATADYQTAEETVRGFNRSNQLIQKINTDLIINAVAKYFTDEGDQLGSGPVPPQVAIPTKYWLLLSAKSLYNPVSGFTAILLLAENVSWTGKISNTTASNIYYHQTDRQIVWNADLINSPTILQPDLSVLLELEIIPNSIQVGQVANLIDNITISAKDTFTGKTITKNIPAITTDLIGDPMENSGGIVENK